jgi:hypothetical protein
VREIYETRSVVPGVEKDFSATVSKGNPFGPTFLEADFGTVEGFTFKVKTSFSKRLTTV